MPTGPDWQKKARELATAGLNLLEARMAARDAVAGTPEKRRLRQHQDELHVAYEAQCRAILAEPLCTWPALLTEEADALTAQVVEVLRSMPEVWVPDPEDEVAWNAFVKQGEEHAALLGVDLAAMTEEANKKALAILNAGYPKGIAPSGAVKNTIHGTHNPPPETLFDDTELAPAAPTPAPALPQHWQR